MGTTAGTRRAGRLPGQVCQARPAPASLRAPSQTIRPNLRRSCPWPTPAPTTAAIVPAAPGTTIPGSPDRPRSVTSQGRMTSTEAVAETRQESMRGCTRPLRGPGHIYCSYYGGSGVAAVG